jgi:hypothetical protein
MKEWLLVMASAVFLLCISQRAFAGCTDQDDLNGTVCQSSSDCGRPCGGGNPSFGGIRSQYTSPLLDAKTLRASAPPINQTPPSRSFSISLAGLALLFSPVIFYRSEPGKWADLIAEKRGRS